MKKEPIRVVWHWRTLGPYHFARMNALGACPGIELTVVESTSVDDHCWRRRPCDLAFRLATLSAAPWSRALMRRTAPAFRSLLESAAPDVIVASGYRDLRSRKAVLDYARERGDVSALFWTESTAFDRTHYWPVEILKGRLVRQFDGALAAGSIHADYLSSLGMARERIAVLGGCVDNRFFAAGAAAAGVRPYFLYVGRFVAQKNLPVLLEAYRRYRAGRIAAWDLVLVGAGPDESRLAPGRGVRFAGLKQAEELPSIYASAGCFVLPSLSEPWGLVVNEAMSAGLPVLISRRCGCAADLVREGRNGYLFDPESPAELASLMAAISGAAVNRAALGAESRRIVRAFTVENFAARAAAHLREMHAEKAGLRREVAA